MSSARIFEEHTQRYDDWFERNKYAYESEILTLKSLRPPGKGLEIGTGTGRFAPPLEIHTGLEPSRKMANMARTRGIDVIMGVGERLPFADATFDFILMVTTICFLDDVAIGLEEAVRMLKPKGSLLLGFVDRDSRLGQHYLEYPDESPFYRDAVFYSVPEILTMMEKAGFSDFRIGQTLFHHPSELENAEPVMEGYGKGAFIAMCGEHSPLTNIMPDAGIE